MPLDSASTCFWKLPPTPVSLTVVRFGEPKTLQQSQRDKSGTGRSKADTGRVVNGGSKLRRKPASSPDVLLRQEAEVTVVDVEAKVRVVAVESDDLALRVGRHPVKEDTLVVLHRLDSLLLLRLTGKVHLVKKPRLASVHGSLGTNKARCEHNAV